MAAAVNPEREELLTSDQIIECLLADPALRHRSSTCILPAVRVGAEWRFRRRDFEAWLLQQRTLLQVARADRPI